MAKIRTNEADRRRDAVVLSQTERQLLVYEIFAVSRESFSYEEIYSLLPVSRKMLQRDLKDMENAGLAVVRFSRKENGYKRDREKPCVLQETDSEQKNRHLKRLARLGKLMMELEADEIDLYDDYFNEHGFVREHYVSAKDRYEEWFPEQSDRNRERDFATLNRIGYRIDYHRRIDYHSTWIFWGGLPREDMGVFLENGVLKRKLYGSDFLPQAIDEDEILEAQEEWEEDNLLFAT